MLCRDESSEGGKWARQETLAMDYSSGAIKERKRRMSEWEDR